MFRLSTPNLNENSIRSIQDQQIKLFKAQTQLSTGLRVNAPSDDPPAAARILDLTQAIDDTNQYKRNINFVQSRLNLEDSTLTGVTDLLQRVRDLAVQANSGTYTTSDRQAISYEVKQRLGELLGLANTKDSNGDYLFAGFQGRANPAAFTDDGNGVYTYHGDQGHRTLTIADNRQMTDGDNGYDLFVNLPTNLDTTSPGNGVIDPNCNVFKNLYLLADALDTNSPTANPTAAQGDPLYIGNYIANIDSAMKRMENVQAQIGGRLNTLDAQSQVHDDFVLTAQSARSDDQDLDYAEAIGRFQTSQTALEAAQKAYSQVQGMSLFKYI